MVPKTDPSFLNLYFQETKKKPRSSSCLPFYVLFVKRSRAWGTTDPNALLQPKIGTRTIVSFVLPFKLNFIGVNPSNPFLPTIHFSSSPLQFSYLRRWCRKMVILQSRFVLVMSRTPFIEQTWTSFLGTSNGFDVVFIFWYLNLNTQFLAKNEQTSNIKHCWTNH